MMRHDDCGRPPTLLEIAVGIEERGERHGHDFTLAGFTPDGHSALLTCAECDLGLTVSQNHRGGWTVVDDDGHDGFNLIDVRCTR